MKTKMNIIIIGLLVMFFAFFNCVQAAEKTIGFAVSTLANPFFISMKEGGEEKAKELGIDMITLDAQDSAEKQISQIQDLITQNVDVLIINPVDSDAVVSAVEEANKAGIPVITVTRPSHGGKVEQHLDIDNSFAGKLVAEELVKTTKGSVKVAILEGIPGAPSAKQRQEGFLKVIKELADNGAGIILLSSEFKEVSGLCDRILVLRKGEIIREIKSKGVSSRELLEIALGGIN